MDFIFMLTRNDKTVEDAGCLVDQVCDLGVTHIGFKDVGVPAATMTEVVDAIRRRGGVCYLEVVSTTPAAVLRSLQSAQVQLASRSDGESTGEHDDRHDRRSRRRESDDD